MTHAFNAFFAILFMLGSACSFASTEQDTHQSSEAVTPSTESSNEHAAEPLLTEEEAAQQAQFQALVDTWHSLDRQTGSISLPDASATLTVPEHFYYLDPKAAETVLVDIWGNPPSVPMLGMLMPAGSTPFDSGSWAVTIEYEEDGYVSDADAEEIDYAELLKDMQADTAAMSEEYVKHGYEPMALIGWASTPFYDASTHKLHWAKEIQFGNDTGNNTLNYNIRILGRKGVLILNFIANMDQKTLIEENLDAVLAIPSFNEGATYSDFNPEIDQVAAYGLGALVAGKVLAKTGLFAALILFLKKFGVYILLGLAALVKFIFNRKKAKAE